MSEKKKVTAGDSDFNDLQIDKISYKQIDFIKSEELLQQELTQKFTPKKLSSVKLSEFYDQLQLESQCDEYGVIKRETQDTFKWERKASRVYSCGTYLEFKLKSDKYKLSYANFCKDRLCPMCNWRRSLKIFSQLSQVLKTIKHDQQYKTVQFLFLTLTVKNCGASKLSELIDTIYDGWKKIYHKNRLFTKKIVLGTFKSLEITRNKKTGEYHPHLHILLAVSNDYFADGNYMTQNDWSDLWKKSIDVNYNPVVYITKVRRNKTSDQIADNGTDEVDINELYNSGLVEVSKYMAKDSDYLIDTSTVRLFAEVLEGRRLCSYTGLLKTIKSQLNLDDAEDGDLTHIDNDLDNDVVTAVKKLHWKFGVYCS